LGGLLGIGADVADPEGAMDGSATALRNLPSHVIAQRARNYTSCLEPENHTKEEKRKITSMNN
jgi:hypothetical protein